MTKWTLGQLGQNKAKQSQTNPNSKKAKINVTYYITKGYENKSPIRAPKKQTQFKPNQTQFQGQKMMRLTINGGTAAADLQDALRADGVDLVRSGDDRKTWKIKAEYSTIATQSSPASKCGR